MLSLLALVPIVPLIAYSFKNSEEENKMTKYTPARMKDILNRTLKIHEQHDANTDLISVERY